MYRRRSLVARLLTWQIIAMGVIWAVLLTWLVTAMTQYESGDLDRRMRYFAQILAETAASAGGDTVQAKSGLQTVEAIFTSGIFESLDNAEHYQAQY